MKDILEKIEQNLELKAKIEELDKAPDSTPQDFIKAAAEYGLELTEANFQPAASKGELADDELEAVTGGGSMADANLCFCAIGGGGEGGINDDFGTNNKTCACVFGGGGEYKNGKERCVCVIGGLGDGMGY